MLDLIETAIGIFILAAITLSAVNTFVKARISQALMEEPVLFQKDSADYAKTLLILGDSTGVGIGAEDCKDSVGGRLAHYLNATCVENHASTGAEVQDLSTQIQKCRLTHYDTILIQIGGNDIIAFHNAKQTAAKLGTLLDRLPEADHLYVMCAGNVGGATLFPYFIRPFHTFMTLAYHKEFAKVVSTRGGTYVNLFEPLWKDKFFWNPKKYLAADGLHPSSDGYGLWFDKLKTAIR